MSIEDRLKQIQSLKDQVEQELAQVQQPDAIEAIRIKYLGRKGVVAGLFKEMGSVAPESRPALGNALNELKQRLQSRIEGLSFEEDNGRGKSEAFFDPTLPGVSPIVGRKHPLMIVMDEIKSIFTGMGFVIEMGPEVETDFNSFEALNIPPHHPARDMQDTFYLKNGNLLRPHTSPVQIRTMKAKQPPIRMIAPGRCFRRDTPDATHSPTFHQVEGLCVDEHVSFADLKGVILSFAQKLFGTTVTTRFRPNYFPFTEPSVEYDFSCVMCGGEGCRVCKGTGWLEIGGAGMVDPAVFSFVDYDSEKYSGYAFGMGVERIAMVKYGIDDIRVFYENDLRFIEQF